MKECIIFFHFNVEMNYQYKKWQYHHNQGTVLTFVWLCLDVSVLITQSVFWDSSEAAVFWKGNPLYLFLLCWIGQPSQVSQTVKWIQTDFLKSQYHWHTLSDYAWKHTNVLTCCSHTSGVWNEKKCVQVSALESMRTGSGGAEPMLGGLYEHNAHIQNIAKRIVKMFH